MNINDAVDESKRETVVKFAKYNNRHQSASTTTSFYDSDVDKSNGLPLSVTPILGRPQRQGYEPTPTPERGSDNNSNINHFL